MSQRTLRTFVWPLVAIVCLAVGGITATLGYLFSAGDYVTQPGAPAYYLGISPLIREVAAPEGAQGREYFGSVGDGNKPPQSQLSFRVPSELADSTWDGLTQQLQGLALRRLSSSAELSATAHNMSLVLPPLKEAEYTSDARDLVVVTTHQDEDAPAWTRFEITHFD